MRRASAQHPARRQAGAIKGDGDFLGAFGIGRGGIRNPERKRRATSALLNVGRAATRSSLDFARGRYAPGHRQARGRGSRCDNLQPDDFPLVRGSGQSRCRKLDIADVVVVQDDFQGTVVPGRITLGKTRNPVSRVLADTVRILYGRNTEDNARRIRGIDNAVPVGNVASVGRKRADVVRPRRRVAADAHGN